MLALKCDYCGREENLPFTCNYCGGTYCGDHRLPESHACRGDLSKRPSVTEPSAPSYSWSGSSFGTNLPPRRKAVFSGIEIRDIFIAWIALSIAFVIAQRGISGFFDVGGFATYFVVSFVAVGSGFVLHELMHKFTAERYGYWAEFRMWILGIVLALATSVAGFIFAAPGATYIQGYNVSERENGIISLAGPVTNILLSGVFLVLLFAGGDQLLIAIGSVGFSVNLILATFNMLPIMPLDGAKVFRWSKGLWIAIFGPLALVVIFVFFIGL